MNLSKGDPILLSWLSIPQAERSVKREVVLHVILPVAIGAAIYLVWRAPSLRVFHWIDAVGLERVISALRVFAVRWGIRPPTTVLLGAFPICSR